ncbi:MAG: ATP-binding protein [Lacisediminihabitans sp.]
MPEHAETTVIVADVGDLVTRMSTSAELPVVLLDGRSGSGKTTLALTLAASYPGGLTLLRLDDMYPGWKGLQAASEHLHDQVLVPRAAGRDARWQRWDWESDTPAEWHEVEPSRPLLVEGCGALSRSNRALASFGLWVELDEVERKRRAFARDGDAYRPFWAGWAAQEQVFINRECPSMLADVVIDGRELLGA